MTAIKLLNSLEKQGITLWEGEGRLHYRAPKGVMNKDLLSEITDKKHEIISVLQNRKKDFAFTLPQIIPDPQQLHQPFPLTDIQHAYWIGRSGVLQLGNIACHAYFEIDIENFDLDRYNQAWHRVIERHDMLRTIILPDGQQQILKHIPLYHIDLLDLRGESPDEVESQLRAIRHRMSHQTLRTDKWPLFKIRASCIDKKHTRTHISLDMLIADFYSVQLIMQETSQLYLDPDTTLSPLKFSFRDYVLAEVAFRESTLYQESREYWINRLPTLPSGPELPLAKNPADLAQPQFVHRTHKLEPDTWLRLKTRTSQAGLTPSIVLFATYAKILSVWSKNPRFSINLTFSDRLPVHPQVNDIVGDFTSLILLEVDNSIQESFETRALRIQRQLWKDMDHRYFGGVRVQRELGRLKGKTQRTVFPIVFTSALGPEQIAENASRLHQMGEFVYTLTETPQVWLDHQVYESSGELLLVWDAVEGLFPDELLDDMFDAYCDLLKRLVDDEGTWQETTFEMIPSAQLERRAGVNATEAPISSEMLHTLFANQVLQQPDHPAVISSNRTLSYEELSNRSNQVGHLLREKGTQPNTLVAVVMEKGWEQVVAVLGILDSGAAYLPIDPAVPKKRLWHLLEDGEVNIVLTQSWLDEELEWPENLQCFFINTMDLADKDTRPLDPVQRPDDLAYVIYTSGSTGFPKGVMIDHRGAVNTILDVNKRFGVGPEDKVLALSNLNFDLSVYDIFGTLAAGGTIVLPDADKTKEPAHWSEFIRREQVTIWNSVPALMQMLVEYVSGRTEVVPQSLRLVLLSGDWIPLDLPDQIKALIKDVQVISLGGATEASIWSNMYPIEEVDPNWKSIPYGRPMVNQRFHVLNEFMESYPDWVPGQLYIGGIGLAKGYWRDEEKTKDSFIIHPRTGERLYRTGDLGRYLPDGNIEFLGREDFQVKIRGYRIELGEIEAALKQHPGVRDAVVTAVGDFRENKRLVGYVVPDQGKAASLFETESRDPAEIQTYWASLVEAGCQESQYAYEETDLLGILDSWQVLEHVYESSVCFALNMIGVYISPGEKHSVEDLVRQYGIHPRYKKWLYRALIILTEKGLLQHHGKIFQNLLPLPVSEKSLDEALQKVNESEEDLGYLITTIAKNLMDILRERLHSAQLYISEEVVRGDQRMFRYCNSIIKEMLRSVVQSFRYKRKLQILEVGAGLCVTTQELLPVLIPEQTTYFCTDISKYFLQGAEKNFEAYPFVNYDLLDIEKSPQAQGYKLHSFDVVVATSVIHNIRNVKETLQYIYSLLVPGGILFIIEETKFHCQFDLFMGLQQGFDRFEDEELRSIHPFLSIDKWQELLIAHGFEECVAFNKDGSVHDFLGLNVIAARVPSSIKQFKPMELDNFLREKLPDYMLPSIYMLLDTLPLTSNGKVDRQALPAPEQASPELKKAFAAPQTSLETSLAKIWSDILSIERVGIHDNFFEIGGDSLVATQVISQVRNSLKVELSVQILYEAPTISKLADMIKKLEDVYQSPLLIPIQAAASGTPIFCIHEAAGSLSQYRALVHHLEPELPVYGFMPRGLNEQEEPHTQIEEMASEYIKVLCRFQPEGPYRILGYCMGGIVAYEMACQLHADGKIVDPLVLIDTMVFPQAVPEDEMILTVLLNFILVLDIPPEKLGLERLFKRQEPISHRRLIDEYSILQHKDSNELLSFIYDVARVYYLPPKMDFDQFKAMFNIVKTNTLAMYQYLPSCFSGSLVLFRAKEFHEHPVIKNMPDFVSFWRNLAQGFRLYDICGDHFSMIQEPNVRILANKIKDLLNEKS